MTHLKTKIKQIQKYFHQCHSAINFPEKYRVETVPKKRIIKFKSLS